MPKLPSCIFVMYLVSVFITIFDGFDAKDLGVEKSKYCKYGSLLIKEGESRSAPIGECKKIRCENATVMTVSALTCPTFFVEPHSNCTVVDGDPTKPYPDCCPTQVCGDHQADIL
ncbi:hypothetical protein ILUMI_00217 [Ignelater luminosus]|uniref:Single domain-containing protein n=1 Tax=Ignelater luminosus TaxID=2038154 RepID=A0A8K0DM21_IGNLU|nr:hypothetical protein ILUMI_00217 [Ignelater luminosus]